MKLLVVIFSFIVVHCFAQPTPVLSKKVAEAKRLEKTRLTANVDKTLLLPIADSTFLNYQSAFWAMMQLQYKPAGTIPKFKAVLSNFSKYDIPFRNATIEVVNSLYPTELEKEMLQVLKNDSITSKQFAAIASYLLRSKTQRKEAIKIIQQKGKEQEKNIISNHQIPIDSAKQLTFHYLGCLDDAINNRWKPSLAKDLINTIVNKKYLANKNLIISFQNKNRSMPGIAVVRDSTGKFYFENGDIFYVPQLARAITNLPHYISNGNTPQGLFAIIGFGNSKNMHIGPTDNLQLVMPFETSFEEFAHTKGQDSLTTFNTFNELLYSPTALKHYIILKESMVAGTVGRTEIIAHGTTVDNNYYKDKPYYGYTPTMGCLQAKEEWNYKTGERILSDQQKLVNAFKATGAHKGYLLVIDIEDSNKPININNIKKLLGL